ncbi:MAG: hypothetical protein U1F12_03040 [Pseudomonadales bacterium]|jgi:hypothetical protein
MLMSLVSKKYVIYFLMGLAFAHLSYLSIKIRQHLKEGSEFYWFGFWMISDDCLDDEGVKIKNKTLFFTVLYFIVGAYLIQHQ